ncbi:hypothetical protein NUSPORA_00729 [Nucleospora cyclopteri]
MFKCPINSVEMHEGQNVVVEIVRIENNIVTAVLLEYQNREGMILSGELSRRRIKNATQATKVGKTEVCQILKIEGKNIDLSLRQVDSQEKSVVIENYKKNKLAYQILEKAANALNKPVLEMYENSIKGHFTKYNSMYNLFATFKETPEVIEKGNKDEEMILEIIKTQYEAGSYKVRADIDVMCDRYNGLALIKNAFDKGVEVDSEIEIHMLNTPTFSVVKRCAKKEEGFEAVEKVLEAIEKELMTSGGKFHLMSPAQIFGEKSKYNILKVEKEEEENSSESE